MFYIQTRFFVKLSSLSFSSTTTNSPSSTTNPWYDISVLYCTYFHLLLGSNWFIDRIWPISKQDKPESIQMIADEEVSHFSKHPKYRNICLTLCSYIKYCPLLSYAKNHCGFASRSVEVRVPKTTLPNVTLLYEVPVRVPIVKWTWLHLYRDDLSLDIGSTWIRGMCGVSPLFDTK